MNRGYKRRRRFAGKRKRAKSKRPITKYKSARGKITPAAYNVEVQHWELKSYSTNFRDNAATSAKPKNTLVLLPCLSNNQVLVDDTSPAANGNWLTPKFLTSKLRISFQDIVPDHADSAQGFKLRVHIGQLRMSAFKAQEPANSYASPDLWLDAVSDLVKQNLVDSNLTSDFMDYAQRNRNIQILSSWLVKPNRNASIRQAITPGAASGENYTAPPPVCYNIKHRIPTFKTRINSTVGPTVDNNGQCLDNLFIPFIALTCDQLTSNTGTFQVEHSSRFYFTDM